MSTAKTEAQKEARKAKAAATRAANKAAKQAALEAQAEENEEGEDEEAVYSMSGHLQKFRARYHRSVAASGAKSLNNGDELANYLQMKTGKEVCELADKWVPLDKGTHFERYIRLNEGQKRMNSGNKLRSALKKGEIQVTEAGITAA